MLIWLGRTLQAGYGQQQQGGYGQQQQGGYGQQQQGGYGGRGAEPRPGEVTKIFIGGLDPSMTAETLRHHFGSFGRIVDSVVMVRGPYPTRVLWYETRSS